VTRTAANAPKHAATRQRALAGIRSLSRARSRGRRAEAIGLVIGLLAGLGLALAWVTSTGQARQAGGVTVTTAPRAGGRVPASAGPDPAALDGEWAAYSNRATCADWAGGDGVSALRLDSTQLAWFFADTFLGPSSPTTGFSKPSGFVHNLVVVQTVKGQDGTFVTMTGGGACNGPGKPSGKPLKSVVAPPLAPGASTDRYWDADGVKVGGTIVKFYNRYLPGGVPFIPTGTVMAAFPAGDLSSAGGSQDGHAARPALIPVPSYVPPAGGTPIVWGAALMQAGDTIYVYGTQAANPSAPDRQLYLARVGATGLTRLSSWQFYTGDGQWAAGQDNAQPVQPAGAGPAIAAGFSVVQIAGRYWLIQIGQPGSPDIDAYPAATPWGPFDQAGITLYHNPDIGLDAAHDYLTMYEARAELALSTSHNLVISFNVNSSGATTGCVPLYAFTNTVLQPKFIAVPTTAFTDGAAGRFTVTTGRTDYPPIAARDPSQWFDSWNYQDGCPPVPGLASVQAQPRAGGVRLTWPDDGLGVRYHVYLSGPGENGGRVAATYSDDATVSGLHPGDYTATVVPVNLRGTRGAAATAQFTVP
jgi:hypothetical protein